MPAALPLAVHLALAPVVPPVELIWRRPSTAIGDRGLQHLLVEAGVAVKTVLREERYERGDTMKEQIVVGTPGKMEHKWEEKDKAKVLVFLLF